MPYRVCKTIDIENGHMLSKHPDACRFPHGHTRRIEFVLEAADLDGKHKITFTEFATLAVLMSSTDEKDADAQVSLFPSGARVCLSRDCAG